MIGVWSMQANLKNAFLVKDSGADPEKILTFSKLPHPKPHPKTTPKNCNFAMKGR